MMKIVQIVLLFLLIADASIVFTQTQDTTRLIIGHKAGIDKFMSDTTKLIEDAALDIAQNRGLFIVTPDQKLQLRILGSVRFQATYDNKNLNSNISYTTYDIPVGENNVRFPNIFFGLEQTRLGFEITRNTQRGNMFVRLETDFAGNNGFRIRHAYGQFGRFLLGQTWSLFTQIVSIPATVDFGSPTGAAIAKTPQIKYTIPNLFSGYNLALAFEYFKPDYVLPDSLAVESFQLIPNVTARIDKTFDWGLIQLSGLVTVLSGKEEGGDPAYLFGWGGSFSAVVNSWVNGKWYFQVNGGKGIARYYNDFEDQGLDLLIDPDTGQGLLPYVMGSFLTYEHAWREDIFSNFTYGAIVLENYSFTPAEAFRWGDSFRINTFWTVVEGARVGLEYIYGARNNNNKEEGRAGRLNFLVYYDF